MAETVNIYDAKTHLSRLIERAEAGEDIVIARAGKPAVRLVPVARPKRVGGQLKGLQIWDDAFFDPLPEGELALWEGSASSDPMDWPADASGAVRSD